jgi:hypothetical protein
MAEVVHNKKLLMHFFQDNLSGATIFLVVNKIGQQKDLEMENFGGCFCQAVQVQHGHCS